MGESKEKMQYLKQRMTKKLIHKQSHFTVVTPEHRDPFLSSKAQVNVSCDIIIVIKYKARDFRSNWDPNLHSQISVFSHIL